MPSISPPSRPALKRCLEARWREILLWSLVHRYGFSRALIAVEKELISLRASLLPMPNRRIDLLCYYHTASGVAPLLLIECKVAIPTSRKRWDSAYLQLKGYNYFIKAPFLAIATERDSRWGAAGAPLSQWAKGLPDFAELIAFLKDQGSVY